VFDPTVRPAVADDRAELALLEGEARAALAEARGGARWLMLHPPVGDGWGDLLDRSDVVAFVAELYGLVVGMLVAVFEDDETIRVAGVYVHPEARECGFGDALMEAATAAGRERGSVRIEGEALPGDRQTKNLYERAGITARLIITSANL
jgi:ribosomal protein S18 acetylase RimI-like enzyme